MAVELDVAKAESYLAQGMSQVAVAKELGVSRTTLRRHLRARRDLGLTEKARSAPAPGHSSLATSDGLPSDLELVEMIVAGTMPPELASVIPKDDYRRLVLNAKDTTAARASAARADSLKPPPGPTWAQCAEIFEYFHSRVRETFVKGQAEDDLLSNVVKLVNGYVELHFPGAEANF